MKPADSDLVSFSQGAVISAAVLGILGVAFSGLRAFREDIPVFGIMMLLLSGVAITVYSLLVIIERRIQAVRRPAIPKFTLWFGLGICPIAVVLSKTMNVYPLDPFEIYIAGIGAYVFVARYVSKRKEA